MTDSREAFQNFGSVIRDAYNNAFDENAAFNKKFHDEPHGIEYCMWAAWQARQTEIDALNAKLEQCRIALLDAKHIISMDLGTHIESIENALEGLNND